MHLIFALLWAFPRLFHKLRLSLVDISVRLWKQDVACVVYNTPVWDATCTVSSLSIFEIMGLMYFKYISNSVHLGLDSFPLVCKTRALSQYICYACQMIKKQKLWWKFKPLYHGMHQMLLLALFKNASLQNTKVMLRTGLPRFLTQNCTKWPLYAASLFLPDSTLFLAFFFLLASSWWSALLFSAEWKWKYITNKNEKLTLLQQNNLYRFRFINSSTNWSQSNFFTR